MRKLFSTALEKAKEAERIANKKIERHRKTGYEQYPLLFTALVSFGAVATFYGLQEILSSVDFLADNPVFIMLLGIVTLWSTGKLNEKLK